MSLENIPTEVVATKIFILRGHRVMLDKDLALLYDVKPIALRQQVKRNKDRFPDDFLFQLTNKEINNLVSQNVIPSKRQLGGASPYVFTEQGVAMLSGVLKSKRAVVVNIAVMRAFVKLREILSTNKELAQKVDQLENRMDRKDKEVRAIFEAIRQLMNKPEKPKGKLGF